MNEQVEDKRTGMAEWYENSYLCPECGEAWTDEWSCMCNDRCPECSYEITPIGSVDLSRPLTEEDYTGASRLVNEGSLSSSRTATQEEAKDYAEAILEGGEYRFAIRRDEEPLQHVYVTVVPNARGRGGKS